MSAKTFVVAFNTFLALLLRSGPLSHIKDILHGNRRLGEVLPSEMPRLAGSYKQTQNELLLIDTLACLQHALILL